MTEINKLYRQLLLPSDLLVSEMAILDEDILIPEVGGKIRPARFESETLICMRMLFHCYFRTSRLADTRNRIYDSLRDFRK